MCLFARGLVLTFLPEDLGLLTCLRVSVHGREDIEPEAAPCILLGDRDHWSGGYGSEAVKLLLYHMFTEMPMKKVYLHTLDWNHRAQRAFEKCGFKIIRPVKRGGWEFFFMELKKERWAELQKEEEDLITKTKAKETSPS